MFSLINNCKRSLLQGGLILKSNSMHKTAIGKRSRGLGNVTFPNCVINSSIKEALRRKSPVVSLESAIITHGMEYPFNLQTALHVEASIREEGALPATIGVIDGKIHVGLTEEEIEFLAKCKTNCVKVSRRDFPYVLAKNFHGGTTVSGTMLISNLVGIPVFVTGGIGGVHRGGENTLDISADLIELGKTPVAVVSAGVKSILDIGRTLEYLETQGVCVASLGHSKAFPNFFTNDSGFESPYNVATCEEAALLMLKRKEMNLTSGILFAVPIPLHEQSDGIIIQKAVDQALVEANKCVRGRDVTPFVLRRVSEITEGKSLLANIALIKNNARHGAKIAVEYSKLIKADQRATSEGRNWMNNKPRPVVIGGSIADTIVKIEEDQIDFNGRSHRGKVTRNFGGVGRNVADALTRLGDAPLFISAVGKDSSAAALLRHNPNMDSIGVLESPDKATASYSVLLDCKGEALIGVGDMGAHEDITPTWVQNFRLEMERAPLVVLDGNVTMETMETVFKICAIKHVPVWFEPTDVNKASKPWRTSALSLPAFMSPNLGEFNAIIQHISKGRYEEMTSGESEIVHDSRILKACEMYLSSLQAVMITFGHKGFMIVRWSEPGKEDLPLLQETPHSTSKGSLVGLYFPVSTDFPITSVSGSGDCLAAGFISGMLRHKTVSECASIGMSSANLSLQASEAVPKSLDHLSINSPSKLPYLLIESNQ